MENLTDQKFEKAKKRVAEIKEFYRHLVVYILVNLFLTFVWNFSFKIFGDFVISNQFTNDGFTHIPIWLIWAVFLVADGIKTFGFGGKFGSDWEEKKIQEFMQKEK